MPLSRHLSRRECLVHGVQAFGLMALASRPIVSRGAEGTTAADLMAKGVDFLRSRQAEDGSWSGNRKEPGITALVVTALLRSKRVTPAEPIVTKALAFLEGFLTPTGGLSEAHSNYSTSIAIMAFQEANKGGRYDSIIKGGQEFLKTMQWDTSEGKGPGDAFYGGAGYGGKNNRPDLSNTAFMMEALHDTGLPADDPALQRALVFVSRCQNLKSEFNDQPWAEKVNDGGFIYTAANGGSTFAGNTENGGLRSYAAMTYAGLKSMIYAGLAADDPRVKAANAYITKHYSLDENPGLGQKGLFYYYQTFAKTMALLGKPTVVDASGKSHDWRAELTAALAKRQEANGSWTNPADSFMEGDPNLVTAYALLALAYAQPKA
ncbi:squalene-hopene/tetraprenyl-beta-curcumene cyclase [Singulisphaera sp. GP187]|uniref:prenyltransferase/squalene oxidase repeat-containing protein n=1 Tax=Singulisphaera sp. GP187 TaxID=1882752 RepID=UPI00092A2D6C|nr:prenyltransferase/squalene oxidase repeat-containing protein [Singulisphaera sp. GP187]SIO26023.1 squalene-hopene/tetraprenyl-beta-curcumene cyclase [Singulisphaera sp. GP187]